jgi:dienelactone hydrolase
MNNEGNLQKNSNSSISIQVSKSLTSKSIILQGNLTIPKDAKGIVLFAHGSGSSRHSPRNYYVAEALNNDGLATLLTDLLTPEEEEADVIIQKIKCKIPGLVLNKFNIKLLANRLIAITDWVLQNSDTQNLTLGYFGASTGAAAALVAAASTQYQEIVAALVSRSGRPDLAGVDYLRLVKAPTLFIVGGNDYKQVIDWNKNALKDLGSEKKKLVAVPNASHLFEEPGTLEEVARVASGWFRCYFQIKQHSNV